MKLISKRLKIIPLTQVEFKLLLLGVSKMEEALNLTLSANNLDPHTQSAMEWLYNKGIISGGEFFWYTNWQIILSDENVSIGSLCFMGPPNNGRVEVGYGINEQWRCHGYMTEALSSVVCFVFSQPDVFLVTAESEKDNCASHRVLEKCGFVIEKETVDNLFWVSKKVF